MWTIVVPIENLFSLDEFLNPEDETIVDECQVSYVQSEAVDA